jgi:uncharacterized protein (DUF58 family)
MLRRLRVLELAARRNVAALLTGDYATTILGQGLLFEESRKYLPGQPARHIDWNVTARTGEPYIKVHRQERQREVFVALDVSPSMHTGFQHKTKLEFAVELAATLAVSAVEGGDKVGLVVFADRLLAAHRPRSGRRGLFEALRTLLRHTEPWRRPVLVSDPRIALHAVQRHRGRRFVVLLISDFLDHDLPEDLKYTSARHDVSLLHVYDPLEFGVDGPAVDSAAAADSPIFPIFRGRAAEGPLGRPGVALGRGEAPREMSRFLESEGARHRIDAASFATDQPVPAQLAAFLHRKRRRQVR